MNCESPSGTFQATTKRQPASWTLVGKLRRPGGSRATLLCKHAETVAPLLAWGQGAWEQPQPFCQQKRVDLGWLWTLLSAKMLKQQCLPAGIFVGRNAEKVALGWLPGWLGLGSHSGGFFLAKMLRQCWLGARGAGAICLSWGEGNFLDLIRASQHTKAINLITSKQRAAIGMYIYTLSMFCCSIMLVVVLPPFHPKCCRKLGCWMIQF